jgi:hypothetical protein
MRASVVDPAMNENGEDEPKLLHLLESMIAGSNFMYAFTSLRQAIFSNADLPDDSPDKFNIQRSDLILTQSSQAFREQNLDIHRYLQNEVTGDAIRLFIDLNREFILSIPNSKVNTLDGDIDNFIDVLDKLKGMNFGIKEFDDEFSNKELVYSITVNRTNKRITVFFRGSVLHNKDWPTNLCAFFKNIPPPCKIEEKSTGQVSKINNQHSKNGPYAFCKFCLIHIWSSIFSFFLILLC